MRRIQNMENLMKSIPSIGLKIIAAATAVAALAGCAGTPPINAMLEEARSTYRNVATDPQAAKNALVTLRSAEEALRQAEKLNAEGADAEVVTHYAYLSKQRSLTAQEIAKQAAAQQSIEAAQSQRDKILIESRTREAEGAMARAQSATALAEKQRMEAEQARQLAEQKRIEAEKARELAEKRLREAELAKAQATEADQRAMALAAQLEELQAKQTDRGMVLTLGDVLFDTGKSGLKAGAMRTIDKLAEFLSANPGRKILIEGHTDSVGSESYNQKLSERRAQAVRNAIGERGISLDRIESVGLGEAYPVASNDDNGGRQQNRRVEVIFSDDSGAFANRRQ